MKRLVFLCLGATFAASYMALSDCRTSREQNTSWTILRPGSPDTYRLVAYGDSIFAGYYGRLSSVSLRAAPFVAGEYASHMWDASMEIVRRTKSGATASEIYLEKIIADHELIQAESTRIIMIDMCGNDYLYARDNLSRQDEFCDLSGLDSALDSCTKYVKSSIEAVHHYAPSVRNKFVVNLYYPGYQADDTYTACRDASTGKRRHLQTLLLEYLARSNWRTCNMAYIHGFSCIDSFAQIMGAEYDSNRDGVVDSVGLSFVPDEDEAGYVERILFTVRPTIRDAHVYLSEGGRPYNLIQSDNIHLTGYGNELIKVNVFGAGSGAGLAEFTNQIRNGKSPVWNQRGHEKLGWLMSTYITASP
jgi:lysophospholipase L1-like esterase